MPKNPRSSPPSVLPLIGLRAGDGEPFSSMYSSIFPSFTQIDKGSGRKQFSMEGLWAEWAEGNHHSPLNASLVFRYVPPDPDQGERLWNTLAESGKILIPREGNRQGEGWIRDPWGLVWQLCPKEEGEESSLVPVLQFNGKSFGQAAAAMDLYEDVLGRGIWEKLIRYPPQAIDSPAGEIYYAQYRFGSSRIGFMNRNQPPGGDFIPSLSMVIRCRNQSEIDYYWDRLSHLGKTLKGGWLADPYGFHWQIIPQNLESLLPAEEINTRLGEMNKIQWSRLLEG